MMLLTYAHMLEIERVCTRAVNAAQLFASGRDTQRLRDLTTLVAELRHAASTLCDSDSSSEAQEQAQERMANLFTPL